MINGFEATALMEWKSANLHSRRIEGGGHTISSSLSGKDKEADN